MISFYDQDAQKIGTIRKTKPCASSVVPSQNNANSGLMQSVYQHHKFLWIPKTESVHNRLNWYPTKDHGSIMGINSTCVNPVSLHRQLNPPQIEISQKSIVFFMAFPGSQVHFIHRVRLIEGVIISLVLHPLGIIPFVIEIPNYRCGMVVFTVKAKGSAFSITIPPLLDCILYL
jgi:hypothetical protein